MATTEDDGLGGTNGRGNRRSSDTGDTDEIDYPQEFVRSLSSEFAGLARRLAALEKRLGGFGRPPGGTPDPNKTPRVYVANLGLEFEARSVDLAKLGDDLPGFTASRRRSAFWDFSERCEDLERDVIEARIVIRDRAKLLPAEMVDTFLGLYESLESLQKNVRAVRDLAVDHVQELTLQMYGGKT